MFLKSEGARFRTNHPKDHIEYFSVRNQSMLSNVASLAYITFYHSVPLINYLCQQTHLYPTSLSVRGYLCQHPRPRPLPISSTPANRPVSAVTSQGRTMWRRWTSEPFHISACDLPVMPALWHGWFTRLHADHDIILAGRSRRSDPNEYQ